jgi:hypothetical protein
MDDLLPVQGRALNSCCAENCVQQFKGKGHDEMFQTGVCDLLSTSELIMFRDPTSTRSDLYSPHHDDQLQTVVGMNVKDNPVDCPFVLCRFLLG